VVQDTFKVALCYLRPKWDNTGCLLVDNKLVKSWQKPNLKFRCLLGMCSREHFNLKENVKPVFPSGVLMKA